MDAYKARIGLTQCFNCQIFGHISENCRQPPRCMWCGGSHIHKERPETNNRENSLPNSSICQLNMESDPTPPTAVAATTPRGPAAEENAEIFQRGINIEGVLLQLHCPRKTFCNGATQQPAAATNPGAHDGSTAAHTVAPTKRRSVSPGPRCKQCVSRQYVHSRHCRAADYDRFQ
jgi:hypothetical protein